MILLETTKLTRAYGGVVAVSEVDFQVREDAIITRKTLDEMKDRARPWFA